MDLAACAAAYGLTGSLVSQVSTSAPTSAASSAPTSVAATSTTSSEKSTVVGPTAPTVSHITPSNGTVSFTTSAPPTQFTGGANALYGGLPALALAAAGAVLAL